MLPLRELSDRRTTSDQIADVIREAILAGEFDDGEELNQVALAKHFHVSRVPLREALRQLQAEGLVTAKAHQRAVVSSLSVDRVLEIRGTLRGWNSLSSGLGLAAGTMAGAAAYAAGGLDGVVAVAIAGLAVALVVFARFVPAPAPEVEDAAEGGR